MLEISAGYTTGAAGSLHIWPTERGREIVLRGEYKVANPQALDDGDWIELMPVRGNWLMVETTDATVHAYWAGRQVLDQLIVPIERGLRLETNAELLTYVKGEPFPSVLPLEHGQVIDLV